MSERFKYWVAKVTYRAWHPLVVIVLMHCYRSHIVTSEQLHEILAKLDRTQPHYALRKAYKRCLP